MCLVGAQTPPTSTPTSQPQQPTTTTTTNRNQVDNVIAAGADIVHFDVMDNHYVPNLTIGPMVCKALRDHGVTAPIDVHLMVRVWWGLGDVCV